MIELRPRETVILASDYPAMVAWYRDTLGFVVVRSFEGEYLYTNLETPSGIRLGIASAGQMGVEPADRALNTVRLQFEVDDVPAFFEHLKACGGVVTFGPSLDKSGFSYGGFTDPEGNPCWVVDKHCP